MGLLPRDVTPRGFLKKLAYRGSPIAYRGFPIAYWGFPIAIGRFRLWIGRSRLLLGVLAHGLGVADCYWALPIAIGCSEIQHVHNFRPGDLKTWKSQNLEKTRTEK